MSREDGAKTARKFPLLNRDGVPVANLAEAKEAADVLRNDRRENVLPTSGHKPKFADYIETYFAKPNVAAKKTGTLQNERFPEIKDGKKVDMLLLQWRIERFKGTEGRGFPMGKRREMRLPLAGVPKKAPANMPRAFVERVRIIHREIDGMTDYEQQALVRMDPLRWPQFRDENVFRVLVEKIKGEVQDRAPSVSPS